MTRIKHSVYINATASVIDAIALSPSRIPEWFIGVVRVKTDRRFPEVDGTAKLKLKKDTISLSLDAISEEMIEGARFTYRTEGLIKGVWTWSLNGEAGGNRLTVTADYELTDPRATTAENLLLDHMITEAVEKSLKNLAVLAQSESVLYPDS